MFYDRWAFLSETKTKLNSRHILVDYFNITQIRTAAVLIVIFLFIPYKKTISFSIVCGFHSLQVKIMKSLYVLHKTPF